MFNLPNLIVYAAILGGVFMWHGSSASARIPVGVNLAAMDDWDIVVAPDAISAERYAAEEFQRLFAEASGGELPIVTCTERADHHVFIGPGEAMRAGNVGFDTRGFGDEDLRIVIRDGNIAIAGGRPRGTLYGVYTFLEDYLGVRFLTHDHTHIPKVGKWRVVGPVDHFYRPPLAFRYSYYGENHEHKAFAVRLRNNTLSGDPRLGGKTGITLINHTFHRQLPVKKYGEDHPEYFAFVDGERRLEGVNGPLPCLTNPDVLRIVTEAVLKELDEHPEMKNISVSQNDAYPEEEAWCHCEKCAAIDEHEGTQMGSLLTFVNAVADQVAKTHPDVLVGTLAYQHTRQPPKHLRPRHNVQIQLCSGECSIMHTVDDSTVEKNAAFYRDMIEWGNICRNISIWNYNTNFSNYQLPCPNLRIIEPNIRLFAAHNAIGVFMQGPGPTLSAELSDLRNYMTLNLLWDPTRSGQALMDEFLTLHYGRAAPPIRRFINLVHDHAEASGLQTNCFGQAKDYAIDESIAQAGLEAFAEALELTETEEIRRRVEKASICAYRAAIDPVYWVRDAKPVKSPELAERMRPLVARWIELGRKYDVEWVQDGGAFEGFAERISKGIDLEYTAPN